MKLANVRPYEIAIEVSENSLLKYGISFGMVADAVRLSSLDMPGGVVKTDGGEILLRTKGQSYRGADFEKIVLLTRPDGTRLLLRDVANVVDGFMNPSTTFATSLSNKRVPSGLVRSTIFSKSAPR